MMCSKLISIFEGSSNNIDVCDLFTKIVHVLFFAQLKCIILHFHQNSRGCIFTLFPAAAVSVLEEIAQRICNRKRKFEASRPHHRTMAIGGGLLIVLLLIALIFGNYPVMKFLWTHSLGYFVMIGVGVLGACLMAFWLVPLFNIHHVNGMATHVEEICTRVKYQRMLSDSSDDTSYHLM